MISNKCYYGLRALLELAVREGRGPVTIGGIAQARQIPVRFLEAILRELKQSGLVDSSRGKDGGYILARPAARIHVREVVELFEGPLVAVGPGTGAAEGTPDVLNEVWKRGQAALDATLESVSFAQLVERERELDAIEASNYSI